MAALKKPRRTKPATRKEFSALEETCWRELTGAWRGMGAKAMVKPGACGAWSVKDVVNHIAAWQESDDQDFADPAARGKNSRRRVRAQDLQRQTLLGGSSASPHRQPGPLEQNPQRNSSPFSTGSGKAVDRRKKPGRPMGEIFHLRTLRRASFQRAEFSRADRTLEIAGRTIPQWIQTLPVCLDCFHLFH